MQINRYPKKIISSKLIESIGFQNSYLKNYYWQNGYIDIVKPSTILKKKSMSGNKIIPFIIKKKNFTIDYRDDLEQIEILLKKQSEKIKTSLFDHNRQQR